MVVRAVLPYLIPIWLFLISQCIGKAVEKKCPTDEWFDWCGTYKHCELKCDRELTEKEEQACLSRVCEKSACVCNDGLYRDKFGNCVEKDECNDMEIITFAPETK
uniref:Anticoagulant peptide 4 n=1 Tax=Ancylostoma duodenale TaxID=51022 RepID=C8XPZ0_9BILA|nr:anticoagulant peptide 4 precursor [Ancylostoma duodenale]